MMRLFVMAAEGGTPIIGRALMLLVAVLLIRQTSCCPSECECTENRYVVCTGSDLTAIPDGIPSNTISLSLYGNKLDEISIDDFSHFYDLITLDLSGNELVSLPDDVFANLTRLETLLLTTNSFFEVPKTALSALVSLQELSLENNPFYEIEAQAFSLLTNLEYLLLGLHYLPEDSQVDDEAFDGLEHLISLSLHNCNFTVYPVDKLKNLKSIQALDLHGNMFTDVPGGTFEDFPYLVMLDLSHNHIVTVDDRALAGVSELQVFDISKNDIVIVPENLIRDAPNCAIDLEGNPLVCNCSNIWLKEAIGSLSEDAKYALETTAFCASPDDVAGLLVWEVEDNVIESDCQSPTIVTYYTSRIIAMKETEFEMKCQSTGVPEPYIQWIIPSRIVLNDHVDYTSYTVDENGTLTIWSVGLGDGGVYACTADNHYDTARKEFELQVAVSAGESAVAQAVAILVTGSVVVFICGLIVYVIRRNVGTEPAEEGTSSVSTITSPEGRINPAFTRSQTLNPSEDGPSNRSERQSTSHV